MRVLVTGGAGFLGSFLVERMVGAGDFVTVLDDLSTGDPSYLAAVREHVALEIGCVTDVPRVVALARGCDRIVHLASTVGVDRVAADPERTREVIEVGTSAVLCAHAHTGAPTTVISSSEVYGFAPPTPVAEDDLPFAIEGRAPRLSYARSKLAADRAALALAETGASVLVVRPFNLIGPRQGGEGGAVLPRFVSAALAGGDLVVHGDGLQRRSFLDVRDAADRLFELVKASDRVRGAVNLGGTIERSMWDLANDVVTTLDSPSVVRRAPSPATRGGIEIARRVPNLTRLKSLVGDATKYSLAQSIRALAAESRHLLVT